MEPPGVPCQGLTLPPVPHPHLTWWLLAQWQAWEKCPKDEWRLWSGSSQSFPSRPMSACPLPTRVPGGAPESWKLRLALHCLLPAWASRRSSRSSESLSMAPPFQGEQGDHLHLSSLPKCMLRCLSPHLYELRPPGKPSLVGSPQSPHVYILWLPFPKL